jgi:benzoyl-CoA reductase subunit A
MIEQKRFSRCAERVADRDLKFDVLMSVFDKVIIQVENARIDLTFEGNIRTALTRCLRGEAPERHARYEAAVLSVADTPIDVARAIGTGYGRQTLPFPKESIRSEILCHGLGAHLMFPGTRTVLDIGGQDTKAIQVDGDGIVTSFQMNDRCAAGCGRYLGYIADEMNLGVHELGPWRCNRRAHVKINSTCTVFAGAELRDRLTMGQRARTSSPGCTAPSSSARWRCSPARAASPTSSPSPAASPTTRPPCARCASW